MKQTKTSPLLTQYYAVKEKHKDKIVLFRIGDFYEMLYDDAYKASEILSITLTKKPFAKNLYVPLAGFPYHAANNYIKKLVDANCKIAICEQVSSPSANKLVDRQVIRIITPGTVYEDELLKEEENNYISCIYEKDNIYYIALLETSSGNFKGTYCSQIEQVINLIENYNSKEILLSLKDENLKNILQESLKNVSIELIEEWKFNYDYIKQNFEELLKIKNIDFIDIENREELLISAGILLMYVRQLTASPPGHIKMFSFFSIENKLILDSATIRNLEIIQTISGKQLGSLYYILKKTKTSMGARKLKYNLLNPIADENKINQRLNAVEILIEEKEILNKLQENLRKIIDIERITSKIGYQTITPRDLGALRESLNALPEILNLIKLLIKEEFFNNIIENFPDYKTLREILNNRLLESLPISPKEGYIFRTGFDKEIDRIRDFAEHSQENLKELLAEEKQNLNNANIKIGFNRVFGYYIEITNAVLKNISIPDNYTEKQTLTNAKRFVTPKLKEYESLILNSSEKLKNLEYEAFCKLREEIKEYVPYLQQISEYIADIDFIGCLSQNAIENDYVKPEINNDYEIILENARHPVVEKMLSNQYIPNDLTMNYKERLIILTGPNMSGKSTYIRSIALNVLLAHIGSYVACSKASIPVTDRIFTRIGAGDDLSQGRSTFMVEMIETANILNNATDRSLVILDEVGRGTSTYDGMAIAYSVAEYLLNNLKTKTLFATHYHELTQMEEEFKGIKNMSVEAREWDKKIVFLHKIKTGPANRSYGVEVAMLANLPEQVIKKAKILLKILEDKRIRINNKQLDLFSSADFLGNDKVEQNQKIEEIQEIINSIEINNITGIQALNILERIKHKIDE